MRAKSLVIVAAALAVVAAQASAGVYFEQKTVAEGQNAQAMNQTVKGWASGENAKIEFVNSGNPMMAKGSYLVTRDGGATMYLVNPKEKTYAVWDMKAMMGMAGGMMKMMNIKFTEPKVEKLDSGIGQPVAGIPTKYYKYRTTYKMEMKFMGMKQSSSTVKEEEIWAAPELVEQVLGVWFTKEPPSTGNEQMDALMKAEMSKVEGFPLKRIMIDTSTDEKGKSTVTRTTMEVTKLDVMPVSDSTFEIPADYEETSLLPMGNESGEGDANPLSSIFGGSKKK